jgi:serine/threonine protein kinase
LLETAEQITMPEANENTPENPLEERTSTRTRVRPAEANAEVSHTPRITNSELSFGPPAASGEVGTLGPYRVLKELGKGGMGAVYLAIDTRLEREIALKVMLPAFAADSGAKERFLREAKAVAKVSHDNVVTVFEADERDGVPYIAMQFLRGYPLDDYLKKKGSPSIAHCVRIAREAALGLAAAHKRGLVHRDIKPANLWLEAPNGRVKVLDFGLAKPISSNTKLTETGAVVGTPAYMSPEQASGQKVDHRTDIFSLGTLLYRLLTGRTPFTGDHILAVLTALAVEEPTPVRELKPSVPPALAELVHQMLAKKPDARPQTATEVAERLRTVLSQANEEVSDSLPVAIEPIPEPQPMEISALRKSSLAVPVEDETDEQTEREPASGRDKATAPKSKKRLLLAVGVIACVVVVGVAIAFNNRKTPEEVAKNPEPVIPLATPNPKNDAPIPPMQNPTSNAARHWIQGATPVTILTLNVNGHTHAVNAAVFNPDGSRIVTGSDDYTAKVWDAETGREVFTLKGHKQWVHAASFSMDGTRILTGARDAMAKVWDATTGTELFTLNGDTDWVLTASYSPDGARIITGGRDSTAKIWDAKTKTEICTLKGHTNNIRAASYSSDGAHIVTGSVDKTSKIWDAKTGGTLLTFSGHTDTVYAAMFSPDNTRVVTASMDKTAKIWNAKTGGEILTLQGHTSGVRAASYSSDGTRIVTASMDKKAKVWDANTGEEILTLQGHESDVYAASFSPDGTRIVTGSFDATAKVWAVAPK